MHLCFRWCDAHACRKIKRLCSLYFAFLRACALFSAGSLGLFYGAKIVPANMPTNEMAAAKMALLRFPLFFSLSLLSCSLGI